MIGPAPALAGAATAVQSAALLVPESHRWIPEAIGHALAGASRLVEEGPGWTGRHARIVRVTLWRALSAVPEVGERDAEAIADGIAAGVSVVRRWLA